MPGYSTATSLRMFELPPHSHLPALVTSARQAASQSFMPRQPSCAHTSIAIQ